MSFTPLDRSLLISIANFLLSHMDHRLHHDPETKDLLASSKEEHLSALFNDARALMDMEYESRKSSQSN